MELDLAAELPELSVSDFVALHNQILEYAMPSVVVVGELSSFRVSKNRWVYFDLKDDAASVKFFGTVYQLPGPLEDGMMVKVRGVPRVHPQFGFSITISSIQPAGEGTIRRAADLLQQKLAAEGLFDESRKRSLPYPPERIGIITSKESAAFADVIKVLNARWGGMEILVADVQVQGEPAPSQIATAIAEFNSMPDPPEVLFITRGGGSADDLYAFSTEIVTRAVASSRIPTIVAVGHEIDTSLAELAADTRGSTPSNAAEILVPDRREEQTHLGSIKRTVSNSLKQAVKHQRIVIKQLSSNIDEAVVHYFGRLSKDIQSTRRLTLLLNPENIIKRGYSIVRDEKGRVVRTATQARDASDLQLQFLDATINAKVKD